MKSKTVDIHENIVSSNVANIRNELTALIESGVTALTLNCQNVEIVDSTGIGFLIRLHTTAKEKGGTVTLQGLNSDILNMLKLMRLDQHFIIEG